MSISYSAIVLDDESRSLVLHTFRESIPENWEVIAHHMTIKMGPLISTKGKYDFTGLFPLGSEMSITVNKLGIDQLAMALAVEWPEDKNPKKKFFHVTVAVNREGGGRPKHSNDIDKALFKEITPLKLRGIVTEIPNKL